MKELLLTLGHNSSAIFMEDGVVVDGWETERVSGVKSDSGMPPVEGLTKGVDIAYVTHWSPDGILNNMGAKYWKPGWLDMVPICTLSPHLTHHDTHMAAAMWYAGKEFSYGPKTYGLVVDGFGTMGEHFSVYRLEQYGPPKLVRRWRGYDTSLGLLYQYATAFMGMKMHEDEYKLLGYEVHVPADPMDAINLMAQTEAVKWVDRMGKSVYGSRYDPVFALDALPNAKAAVFSLLERVCKKFGVAELSELHGRAVLAFFVQSLLEAVVLTVVDDLDARNLILSGGVFYNVKLNHKLLVHVSSVGGHLCAYPLAGDQGNALGLRRLVRAWDEPVQFPESLCFGRRALSGNFVVDGVTFAKGDAQAASIVLDRLKRVGFVNVVRGNMEFGPRALCNTSTLAMPTPAVVERINQANGRNTVMPMAPVMTRDMYDRIFHCTDNVWKSERHMIVAMQYRDDVLHPGMMGVAHRYSYPFGYATGRPQVVDDDPFMEYLLTEIGGPLINTSFNFHGNPIAFGMPSIAVNHKLQRGRDQDFTTVVIENE